MMKYVHGKNKKVLELSKEDLEKLLLEQKSISGVARFLNVSRSCIAERVLALNIVRLNKTRPVGLSAWNKRLTKENDSRVLNYSKKCSKIVLEQYQRGRVNPFKNKIHSEKSRQLMSQSIKKIYAAGFINPLKDKTFEVVMGEGKAKKLKQHLSNVRKARIASGEIDITSAQEKGQKAIYRRTGGTQPEKDIEVELKRNGLQEGIDYEVQKKISNYIVDFVLLKDKIALFVDGCYWHRCPICKSGNFRHNIEKDELRPSVIEKADYKFVRVWEHDVKSFKLNTITLRR